jgi:ABC-type transport system involved in cytochrome bd biosynthesis fused ATPase/permease subunit
MSQGQLEKLALEEGLRPGRKVYLLDEVTAHLDSASQKETVKRIKELSKTSLVLIICHDLDLREVADAVWEIRKGELFLRKGFLL